MHTFTTPGPIAATVQVAGAQVRLTASARPDTVVLVEPIDRESRSDVRVADRTKVDFAHGRLSVKTTVSGKKHGSIAITIDLPAGSGVVAYLAHSGLHADGSFGACELHMASGRVQLDRIDALEASVRDGAVVIGSIVGRADLSSSSGSFDIGCADGRITAETGDGAVRIGKLARGRAELMTGSGNIEIGISEGTAASVDAKSERGSVRSSVPPHDDPAAADQEVAVRARTRHGDIVIHRAAG